MVQSQVSKSQPSRSRSKESNDPSGSLKKSHCHCVLIANWAIHQGVRRPLFRPTADLGTCGDLTRSVQLACRLSPGFTADEFLEESWMKQFCSYLPFFARDPGSGYFRAESCASTGHRAIEQMARTPSLSKFDEPQPCMPPIPFQTCLGPH